MQPRTGIVLSLLLMVLSPCAHSEPPDGTETIYFEPPGDFDLRSENLLPESITLTASQEVLPPPQGVPDVVSQDNGEQAGRFTGNFSNRSNGFDVGADLYSPPEFEGGLIVFGDNIAMKISGLVKADFIYDFDPIDETDSFVTTSIPVGAPPRTNARFHARQTRLSFDTRWATEGDDVVKIYFETDFFSEGDRFRLRHAYGEYKWLLVGQTWTTFTDVAAAPATLDFEGSVSSVNRRQAQARATLSYCDDLFRIAMAIEDARLLADFPPGVMAETRTPSPDFTGHIRLQTEWGRFQIGGLYRVLGGQDTGITIDDDMKTSNGWGLNFTGVVLVTDNTKAYYQVIFGEGIGSYRGLPDAVPAGPEELTTLPLLGWMVGFTHQWNDRTSSNFTYAENSLENSAFQPDSDVHRTTYLAANVIYNPVERVKVGIEYLYGMREDVDGGIGTANRLQAAFIFDLP